MKAPEETCSKCGKRITGRSLAHVVSNAVVCSTCRRKIESERERGSVPATDPQRSFLANLGFPNTVGWTLGRASETIDRAQKIRYFAFQVARQEWGADLYGIDLASLVQWVFPQSDLSDAISATMAWSQEITIQRKKEHISRGREASSAECAPDVPKDAAYFAVRQALVSLCSHRIKEIGGGPPQRPSQPMRAAKSGIVSRIISWFFGLK